MAPTAATATKTACKHELDYPCPSACARSLCTARSRLSTRRTISAMRSSSPTFRTGASASNARPASKMKRNSGSLSSGTRSRRSSCERQLAAPREDQQQIVQRMALGFHLPDTGWARRGLRAMGSRTAHWTRRRRQRTISAGAGVDSAISRTLHGCIQLRQDGSGSRRE